MRTAMKTRSRFRTRSRRLTAQTHLRRLPHLPPSRRARTVLAAAGAVLVTLAVAAELGARGLIHHRIASAAAKRLGTDPDVDTGGLSALAGLVGRHLPYVELSAQDAVIGKVRGAAVRLRMNDVRLAGSTVADSHAEVMVPAQAFMSLSRLSSGNLAVSSVRADPASDTLSLALGRAGLGQVTLRPEIRDGRVAVTVADASFLGAPAPVRMVERIEERLSGLGGDRDYPLSLRATSAQVTAEGLHITLDGGRARLPGRGA